jgi:Domain of unknown function (DUF305)
LGGREPTIDQTFIRHMRPITSRDCCWPRLPPKGQATRTCGLFRSSWWWPKGGGQDTLTLVGELVCGADADLFGAGTRVDAGPARRSGGCGLRSTEASSFDAVFLDLMTRLHKGAVAMVGSQLRDGVDPRLRIMAHAIRHAQQGEIALLHGMSGGNAVSFGFRNMFADNVNTRGAFGVNQAHWIAVS